MLKNVRQNYGIWYIIDWLLHITHNNIITIKIIDSISIVMFEKRDERISLKHEYTQSKQL